MNRHGGPARRFATGPDGRPAAGKAPPPCHADVDKRLVKSPKTHVRDSGLVRTLLRRDDLEQVLGQPIARTSREGHVIETLLRAAPARTRPSFHGTAAGAESDLVLELPRNRPWVVETERGIVAKLEKGFHDALEDLQSSAAFVIYSGAQRYSKGPGIEAMGVREMAALS